MAASAKHLLNTDDSTCGTALAVKLLVKLLGSVYCAAQTALVRV